MGRKDCCKIINTVTALLRKVGKNKTAKLCPAFTATVQSGTSRSVFAECKQFLRGVQMRPCKDTTEKLWKTCLLRKDRRTNHHGRISYVEILSVHPASIKVHTGSPGPSTVRSYHIRVKGTIKMLGNLKCKQAKQIWLTGWLFQSRLSYSTNVWCCHDSHDALREEKKIQQHTKKNFWHWMFKSLNTERSRHVFLGRRRPLSSAFCDSVQTFSGAGRLLSTALPCQTLHEATGNCRDDDDAHEQSGGHPDDQGDEEQVSNWRGNPERQVEGI